MRRAAYFAAAMALAAVLAAPAWARIGVTSVTAGTTSAVQGTDLQAGQHITTGADGRVHLMFVDGSAVTVGPNSTLRIESYSYDPATKTGAMTLDVQQGTIRFVGGAISKKADVQIRTPSSTVGIRGGIAAVSVGESGATSADFLHGSFMHVTGQGVTQTATRSGSQINVPAGRQPAMPTVLSSGQMTNIQSIDRTPSTNRLPASPADSAFAKSDLPKHNSSLALGQPSHARPVASSPRPTDQVQAIQSFQQQMSQQQASRLTATTPPPILPSVAAITRPQALPPAVPMPTAAAPITSASTPPSPTWHSICACITMVNASVPVVTFVSGGAPSSGAGTMSGTGTLTKSGAGTVTLIGK